MNKREERRNLFGKELLDSLDFVRSIKAPVVIDHIGRVDAGEGPDGRAFRALRSLVDTGKVWVKVARMERSVIRGNRFNSSGCSRIPLRFIRATLLRNKLGRCTMKRRFAAAFLFTGGVGEPGRQGTICGGRPAGRARQRRLQGEACKRRRVLGAGSETARHQRGIGACGQILRQILPQVLHQTGAIAITSARPSGRRRAPSK